MSKPVDTRRVRDALAAVEDPELGIGIVDLGLVRGIDVWDGGRKVLVHLTLTSPGCPLGPQIIADVKQTARALPGVQSVEVVLVWSPPWDPRVDASEDGRVELGIWL
jgi:metal-sulfur cluster biosynthetic enzyme